MRLHFAGRMSELLATLRVMLDRVPSLRAMDVTPGMLAEARVYLRRN